MTWTPASPALRGVALGAFDRDHLWHPYASMTDPSPTYEVTSAHGVRLRLADGREVVDAMASWWCAIHGYAVPALDAAVGQQTQQMAHVMFGGLTHSPAVELARRLITLTPAGLQRVFFADSGSVSVEVALKMVLQAQHGRGRPERTRMLAMRGGYHGDTLAPMSVCDPVDGMHTMFTGVLPEQVFAPRPPAGPDADVSTWARAVTALVEQHSANLAGIIVEPVLQGAGGMYAYPPACLRVLRDLADEHALLLVFDEIATGLGRTGTMFAAEQAGISPDLMCVGKALTGGYLTLAAVLVTDDVARAVSGSQSGAVMHGPTFMANPLACAVACASIDLLLHSDWAAQVEQVGAGLARGLAPLRAAPGVADVRTIGAVGVVQLDRAVDVPRASALGIEHGVWLRPFRDLVYTMPPYVCSGDDVDTVCAGIVAVVEDQVDPR
ncbi:MAG: adenosylmethionine--8-amino-7-oxononanoate transaminase [Actinomycetota bacterium]|nr:adenosylmethionine--8-amino-7-oxononanoate transaminase [Actinomycetota bacterium]